MSDVLRSFPAHTTLDVCVVACLCLVLVLLVNLSDVKDTTTSIKATDAFLKEILEVWAEVNLQQQIKSQEQFQEQSYGTTLSSE